jgi:DNA-binding NtrC family response regulator
MSVLKLPTQTLEVLVVEDERRLRALLVDMIPELGFTVRSAGTGEEALSMINTRAPDILLLDLHLPNMSGMDLFERVRVDHPKMQVVILTAFGDLESAQRAIRLDVVEFLCKPFHLRDLELAFDRARKRLPMEQRLPDLSPAPAVVADATTLADAEYRHIVQILRQHNGNRTAAASELGISRRTLHYRLAEYRDRGLEVD